MIDLGCVFTQEPCALHNLRLHQSRGYQGDKAVLQSDFHSELHQAHLQQRSGTAEEVKPGARDLNPAVHIDDAERFPEIQVVARLKIKRRRCAHGLQGDKVFFAAGGNSVDHDIRQRTECPVGILFCFSHRGSGDLDGTGKVLDRR